MTVVVVAFPLSLIIYDYYNDQTKSRKMTQLSLIIVIIIIMSFFLALGRHEI